MLWRPQDFFCMWLKDCLLKNGIQKLHCCNNFCLLSLREAKMPPQERDLVYFCQALYSTLHGYKPNRNVLTILQTGLEISYLVDKNRLLPQKPQDISLQDLWIQHEYNHRLLHFPADEFLNRPFKTAAMLMLSILVPYNAFPVLLRIQYMVSARDVKNSNFLWFPNFYIAINIYVKENSTDSFHLLIVRLRNLPLRPRYRPGTTHPRGRIQDFF